MRIHLHASSNTCIHLSACIVHHMHRTYHSFHHSHLHSYPLRSSNTPVQLVRAGHEVRLYIAPEYQPLVPTLAGLSVICSQQTCAAGMQKIEPYIANGNQAALFQALVDTSVEFFAQEADAIKAVCEGWAEVVIFNHLAGAEAFSVAKVLNIKLVGANVQPVLPTRELSPLFGSVKLPKFMNMFIWWLLGEKIAVSASLDREVEKWLAANGAQRLRLEAYWAASGPSTTCTLLQMTTLSLVLATLTSAPRGCLCVQVASSLRARAGTFATATTRRRSAASRPRPSDWTRRLPTGSSLITPSQAIGC